MSSFRLPFTITYWLAATRNATGGKTYSPGEEIAANIAETSDLVNMPEGKQIMATKAIYTKTALPVGTYVVEGEYEGDAAPPVTAQQVLTVASNRSMSDMVRLLV